MMFKSERIFFVCYKLTKLELITFQYTEMAGKLSNLRLVGFENIFFTNKVTTLFIMNKFYWLNSL